MEAVFGEVVNISLMANWLIAAVIVLRMLLKKAPRRMVCMLWAIVALRLMFPFSVESPVSMIPQTASAIQEAVDTTLIHPAGYPIRYGSSFGANGNDRRAEYARPRLHSSAGVVHWRCADVVLSGVQLP